MEERQNNKRPSPEDIQRYRENRMTNKERNAFERELQKDPFLDEALEGLSSVNRSDAAADLKYLESRLKTRTRRKNRLIAYRIAASVAVLMIISSVFIVIERNKQPQSTVAKEEKASPVEIQEPNALKDISPPAKLSEEVKQEPSAPVIINKEERKTAGEVKPEQAAVSKEVAAAAENIKADKIAETEKLAGAGAFEAAPKSAAMRSERASDAMISGRIISSEDMKPIPGASVTVKGTTFGTVTDIDGKFVIPASQSQNRDLVANFIGMESKEFRAKADSVNEVTLNPSTMALNEVVVTGYGQKKLSDRYASVEYKSAEPAEGFAAFNEYIEKNLVKPAVFRDGDRVVVVVSFRVRSNGMIDSIKIIRGGGQQYSDEAIRLIKEGPAWKPATDNGSPVDEDVRVRIVFK